LYWTCNDRDDDLVDAMTTSNQLELDHHAVESSGVRSLKGLCGQEQILKPWQDQVQVVQVEVERQHGVGHAAGEG
jgi:hypothetical protein